MVDSLRNRFGKIDSKIVWSVVAFFFLSLAFTWSIGYTFNEVFQEVLYPYSRYPVVVHSGGDIIMLPGLVLMWLITLGGINHILLTLFDNRLFKSFKEKLTLLLVGTLVVMGVVFILDIVFWPVAAKANGYSPCPYDTLLFGQKISTAWSKNEAFCYDPGVQTRLSTGTFEQVEQVAKYLEDKKK